jgi:predicted secreted Zn-dependent protease
MLICLNAFTQSKTVRNDSILIWSQHDKLSWDDFLSEKKHLDGRHDPQTVTHASAILSVSIKFLPRELGCENIDDIIIVPVVNRKKSMAILKSDKTLKHEQIHFDITELYARKMRKAIENLLDDDDYECNLQEIADIYHQLVEEHWQAQFLYDKQIRIEGEEEMYQKKWGRKTDSLLNTLKDYKQEIFLEDLEQFN